jgi:hypothetical protein
MVADLVRREQVIACQPKLSPDGTAVSTFIKIRVCREKASTYDHHCTLEVLDNEHISKLNSLRVCQHNHGEEAAEFHDITQQFRYALKEWKSAKGGLHQPVFLPRHPHTNVGTFDVQDQRDF